MRSPKNGWRPACIKVGEFVFGVLAGVHRVVFVNIQSVDRIVQAIFSRFNIWWKNHTLEISHTPIDVTALQPH